MKIAHLLPYTAQFPLKKHNGRYEWALRLAKIQAERGHEVSVYAAPGSKGQSGQITWHSLDHDFKDKKINNIALIKSALQDSSYDIYHSHFDYLHYFIANSTNRPIVATQHWFPGQNDSVAAQLHTSSNVFVVAPTKYMAEEDARLGIKAETIYHGVDLSLFKPRAEVVGDRLIFVGRITPQKGVLQAVKAAVAANQKLDIVGKINDTDKEYWRTIEPLLDGDKIRYLGAKTQPEVAELFSNAKAFIFPAASEEAFGQVTVEAQACGTPVIISDVGASRELVDDGKSGFVVSAESEYTKAIKNIGRIDRSYCRKFAQKFDLNLMIESYEELYRGLLAKR